MWAVRVWFELWAAAFRSAHSLSPMAIRMNRVGVVSLPAAARGVRRWPLRPAGDARIAPRCSPSPIPAASARRRCRSQVTSSTLNRAGRRARREVSLSAHHVPARRISAASSRWRTARRVRSIASALFRSAWNASVTRRATHNCSRRDTSPACTSRSHSYNAMREVSCNGGAGTAATAASSRASMWSTVIPLLPQRGSSKSVPDISSLGGAVIGGCEPVGCGRGVGSEVMRDARRGRSRRVG